MTPAFNVPAEYFYVLAAGLPINVGIDARYELAVTADPKSVVTDLHNALDAGVIRAVSPVTPEQAARRLVALADFGGTAPAGKTPAGSALVTRWLAYANATPTADPAKDIAPFWNGVVAPTADMTLSNPDLAAAHLELIVCAVAMVGDPAPLIGAVRAEGHPLGSVKDLDPAQFGGSGGITTDQWKQVFDKHPDAIPAFAKIGASTTSPQAALAEQTAAFVLRLSRFFDLPAPRARIEEPLPGRIPELNKPVNADDRLGAFIAAFKAQSGHAEFAFGQTAALDLAAAQAAAAQVFPNDAHAAEWLAAAASALNAVYAVASIPGVTDAMRFSIAEALYARGFTSVDSITGITDADFQDALFGTPAYPYASRIKSHAGTPAPALAVTFVPINDGTLANCLPPSWLSPLGPVQYLHELWTLSEAATCEHPEGDGKAPTLGSAVTGRRGPLGDLLATQANLATALPQIDLVIECLELLVENGAVNAVYQTAGDMLAGHLLAPPGAAIGDDAVPFRHDPDVLFAALPEHSSPGAALPAAYAKLRNDFSAPMLPYAQPLDVSRSYLGALHTTRDETMRLFGKDITEFVHDPDHPPADFPSHLWRYPMRREIACEYLGISPEEYSQIFATNISLTLLVQLYGFADPKSMEAIAKVSEFLARTGLDYCDFIELWRSGFVQFRRHSADPRQVETEFPLCEPCYPDKEFIVFANPAEDLTRLIVLIRLWHKLQHVHGVKYSFTELADIATVLQLFLGGSSINPDFIRQFAACHMLRMDFGLELRDESDATAGTGADRTHILALFAMPPTGTPVPRKWDWAIGRLIHHVEHHARSTRSARHRSGEFSELLVKSLDPLSRLAGFDPSDPVRCWHSHPTHALCFADDLSKIYASHFSVGEILLLFTVDDAPQGDDPFPLPGEEESLEFPLDLPDDAGRFSLWSLRCKLLEVEVSDEDAERWTWPHIARSLRDEFGFVASAAGPDPVLTLGAHFFPEILERAGTTVAQRRYRRQLPAVNTSPQMWNAPAEGPFHYDAGTEELTSVVPLTDEAVIEKLSRIRPLSSVEAAAVSDLYFLPRVDLAPFAFLFPSFEEADRRLIQECDGHARWAFFRRSFARCHARCKVIACHLAEHVAAVTAEHDHKHDDGHRGEQRHRHEHDRHGYEHEHHEHGHEHHGHEHAHHEHQHHEHQHHEHEHHGYGRAHDREHDHGQLDGRGDDHVAWRVLKQLPADENKPNPSASWQDDADAGKPPAAAWQQPSGGAFAALLGLLGTGLLGELRYDESKTVLWRELCGPMNAFGRIRNAWNVPVPTVLPALDAVLPPDQTAFIDVRNGIAIANAGGRPLGGAEGYCVNWSGVLLVDEGGSYEFFAGAYAPDEELPKPERAHGLRWRVTLRRGVRFFEVLTHDWPGHHGAHSPCLTLKRGAYDISIELFRCPPQFHDADDVCSLKTGFELKYAGPDTDGAAIPLPLHRLFIDKKDGPLSNALDPRIQGAAQLFLQTLYVSSLRDARRTYRRAFGTHLFLHRFGFSARAFADYEQSEIGYFLDHPDRFMGMSFNWNGTAWASHRAWFNFDFLPVRDPYKPPADDDRAQPSVARQRALFDWFRRMCDYAWLRGQSRTRADQPAWLLFDDAAASPAASPEDPKQLLRYLGINASYAPLVLAYDNAFAVVAADLTDERWPLRIRKAEQWLRGIERAFAFKDVRAARPDLWADSNPGANGGNDNLIKLVQDACLENAPPRRYEDLTTLNNRLRERARRAMIGFLCGPNGGGLAHSAMELSERLLIDVEVGLCERASRVEDAAAAMQAFVQRARLGLEQPGWSPSPGFAHLWDGQFASFSVWKACKRRTIYREDTIECSELEKARRTEGFRFLERELRSATLTVPEPGGLVYWNEVPPPAHPGLKLLQASEPSTLKLIPGQPQALNLLGSPERSARRSWLASMPGATKPGNIPPSLSFWIEAAIGLGDRFLRIPAAGIPPASNPFGPYQKHGEHPCCCVCGRRHEAVMDEYYFWLVDGQSFATDDPARDPNANWEDDPGTQNPDLPTLLLWPSRPEVYLMSCRMHDGVLQQPRRSTMGVAVDPAQAPWGLTFDGRRSDSLYFEVTGAAVPPPGYASTPPVGFRFDLVTDSAIAVPEVSPDPPVLPSLGGLPAYPYFTYFPPGEPLVPLSMFSEAMTVACVLRSHCRFEAALKWYEAFYNPLVSDARWCWDSIPKAGTGGGTVNETTCCRYSDVPDDVAQKRSIAINYVETLLEWGDAIMRRNNTEAFQQARLIFDTAARILGKRPSTINGHDALTPAPTVGNLDAALIGVPLNSGLTRLYDITTDRLGSIHACLNARRLRNGRLHRKGSYWGDDTRAKLGDPAHICGAGCGCHDAPCADEDDWCCLPSPYRFVFLVQQATGLASEVRAFGASLLSAFEKGDAEYLAYVRANNERQLTERALEIHKNSWHVEDWGRQALHQSLLSAQNQLQYYDGLIQAGLNFGENQHVSLTNSAIVQLHKARNWEFTGTVLGAIPDQFYGQDNFMWMYLGTKAAGVAQGVGQIHSTTSQIQSTKAGLALTQSGWYRRAYEEWNHQRDIFRIEIERIKREILGSERRRANAAHELRNTQLQIEHARETLDLMRDKFTSHDLYLHLQNVTVALHRQIYDLALRAAHQAQRAFRFELGYTNHTFIAAEPWNDLREALHAGEQLSLSLHRMETAYHDANVREYELTKHISLRQLFPAAFLRLRATGSCEFEIPEVLFDLDYPGHYMRRIKSVALTIPCVIGPYATVHCQLTLLASATRIAPWLLAPVAACCEPPPEPQPPAPGSYGHLEPTPAAPRKKDERPVDNGYPMRPDDSRIVWRYGAVDAIATSSGQNDSGMFELNFRDERFLKFEGAGAASRWRIKLRQQNNYFDIDTLSDVVMHVNFTAREGGDVLCRAASEAAQRHVPDAGRRLFDARRDFAEAWARFQAPAHDELSHRQLELHLGRDMFMFLPGNRDVTITRLDVFFEAPEAVPGRHREVGFAIGHRHGGEHAGHDDVREFQCVASAEWPGLYHGGLDVRIGPLGWREHDLIGHLRFHASHGDIRELYVICSYETGERTRGPGHPPERHLSGHHAY